MWDWLGGGIITGGYLIAMGLIFWDLEIIPLNDWFGFESTAPLFPETGTFIDKFGIPGTVGLGLAVATTVFGILRPIFYHRLGSGSKVAVALSGARIAVIPGAAGIKAVRLGYTFHF
jgi:hypothetical protein